jgi:hypothetical protein
MRPNCTSHCQVRLLLIIILLKIWFIAMTVAVAKMGRQDVFYSFCTCVCLRFLAALLAVAIVDLKRQSHRSVTYVVYK